MKPTIKDLRSILKISRAEFSRMYGIPVRTLENWEARKSECPAYVFELIEKSVLECIPVEKFEHYGEKIILRRSPKPLRKDLTERGVEWLELPVILNDDASNAVIQYNKNGHTAYAIAVGRASHTSDWYDDEIQLFFSVPPADGDYWALFKDVMYQENGHDPATLPSKPKMLIGKAYRSVKYSFEELLSGLNSEEETNKRCVRELFSMGITIERLETIPHPDVSDKTIEVLKDVTVDPIFFTCKK